MAVDAARGEGLKTAGPQIPARASPATQGVANRRWTLMNADQRRTDLLAFHRSPQRHSLWREPGGSPLIGLIGVHSSRRSEAEPDRRFQLRTDARHDPVAIRLVDDLSANTAGLVPCLADTQGPISSAEHLNWRYPPCYITQTDQFAGAADHNSKEPRASARAASVREQSLIPDKEPRGLKPAARYPASVSLSYIRICGDGSEELWSKPRTATRRDAYIRLCSDAIVRR